MTKKEKIVVIAIAGSAALIIAFGLIAALWMRYFGG
jgi:hypothetical protein